MGATSKHSVLAAGVLLAGGAACGEVSFNEDIRPILSNACFRCHGPDEEERKADLRLDTREGALADLGQGIRAVVPGDLDASELFFRITTDDSDDVMPPPKAGKRLTPEQVGLFRQWIEEGAPYERHWAYVKPERPPVPVTRIKEWSRNPVDAFLLERLESEGLRPSPEADREILGRRVALDLTGLPLTPEEARAFAGDASPDAYERLVRDLLDRPAFGEHWARMWLDLARYADSAGYADDPPRTIWAYRDYVIRSFNANKPFDEFTREQLAGDLLPDATDEQLVATAFHRNTQTNSEGGTDDEEYRNVAVVDRVNTTGQVWLGTTLACAQCHTHKYDPITHEDYFEMFAIFNNTEDSDKKDERPTLGLLSAEQRARRTALGREIARLEEAAGRHDAGFLERMETWIKAHHGSDPGWIPVMPETMQAASGATLTGEDDGSIIVSGTAGKTDVYTVTARAPVGGITAVRLEALPDERLGSNGPGRKGNFVVSEFELTARAAENEPVMGRYVRLELPGKKRILSVAEVEVFSGGENVAPQGAATQSSTDYGGLPRLAIDGNTNGNYAASKSVTHTKEEADPWWEVDLGRERDLSRVVVWNRTDGNIQARLDGFRVTVLDARRNRVHETTAAKAPKDSVTIGFDGAREVKLQNATATFSQKDFDVSRAIDGGGDAKSGWAVAPQTGRRHAAVFETADGVDAEAGLVFTIRQGYADLPLGRFRIAVTDAARPVRAIPSDVREILAKGQRGTAEEQRLRDHFAGLDPVMAKLRAELDAKKGELAAIKPSTTVPVMRELAAGKGRKTHIQIRGNFLDKAGEVGPGVPEELHAWRQAWSKDRHGLAEWILDPGNPLTARVVVNRFWEKMFGIGLVATSEEFGSQGEPPSHPELLDWLAVDFVESGWDVKRLLELLVTTAAYRQDSAVSEEMAERDPRNRLVARGPRFRLTAEMVRDQSLFAAGLLSSRMYGPPVNPLQPNLGVKAAFGGGIDWKTSKG
ncbi:MAG: DUF1549 domain-containing protein, partial [Akkermansiaceae bacterium]|nr:DUF1549 domain-containing protein [Akkermansiaceae bacterium]